MPGSASPPFLPGPAEEAARIVDAATEQQLQLRVAGGVGVLLACPSAGSPPLRRDYQDIDMVANSKQTAALTDLLIGLGYQPEAEFNAIHGQHRMFFLDSEHQRQIDVFLDGIEACHHLQLRDRLELAGPALTVADLLLSKLQVVETNEKDYQDAIAIFADHPTTTDETGISLPRLEELCGTDWGWWRTVTGVAEKTDVRARDLALKDPGLAHVPDRIRELIGQLESMPKTRRWKMRAKVGERRRWYELPEDVEHSL